MDACCTFAVSILLRISRSRQATDESMASHLRHRPAAPCRSQKKGGTSVIAWVPWSACHRQVPLIRIHQQNRARWSLRRPGCSTRLFDISHCVLSAPFDSDSCPISVPMALSKGRVISTTPHSSSNFRSSVIPAARSRSTSTIAFVNA